MWCAISKLCTKENQSDPSASECEPIDPKRMEPQDTTQTYDTIKVRIIKNFQGIVCGMDELHELSVKVVNFAGNLLFAITGMFWIRH